MLATAGTMILLFAAATPAADALALAGDDDLPVVRAMFQEGDDDQQPGSSEQADPFQDEPLIAGAFEPCVPDDRCGTPACFPAASAGVSHGRWLGPIHVDGWFAQGLTINTDSPANRSNFPVTFNDRSNEYLFNQVYLVMERPVDRGGSPGIGGRVDLLFGSDARFTSARGLELNGDLSNKWNAGRYGLAMPQLYAEVYAPWGSGLSMKLGHFYTILGYETVPAVENFFYSHSYAFQYGQPFTHTGFLGSTRWGQFNVHAGMTRGWNNWEDNNNDFDFITGVDWTSCDGRTLIVFSLITGREQDEPPPSSSVRTTYSLVVQHQINDRLQWVAQHDYGYEADGLRVNEDAKWYGVNNYLFYTINCAWTAGMRFEWFRDEQGTRVASGSAGDYFALTSGLNWKPNTWITLRPSLRWDWVGNGGFTPMIDGTRRNQLLLDCDLIVRF